MADTRELTPGSSMELPPVPLRISLTGDASDAVLSVEDGDASAVTRISAGELILAPFGGFRCRVEATPAAGTTFPARTRFGLDIKTESRTVESRQGLVKATDAGALQRIEMATIELREHGWWVVATHTAPARPHQSMGAGATPRPGDLDESVHSWIGPGRFALRRARSGGEEIPDAHGRPWALVVDSSASMRTMFPSEAFEQLVTVVAGTFVEWTGSLPVGLGQGGQPKQLAPQATPVDLVQTIFDSPPPAWNLVCSSVRECIRVAGGGSVVVILSNGVPGDVAELAALMRANPEVDLFVMAAGTSRFGLPSETHQREPWAEVLWPLEALADLPNVRIVAFEAHATGGLDEARSAELAAALLGERG